MRLLFALLSRVEGKIIFLFQSANLNELRLAHKLDSMGWIDRADDNLRDVIFVAR
jgi:hypothetical protein